MALNPGLHFFELQIEKSVLAILISSGAILLGILVAERPGGRGAAVLLGLSLGLLTLLRGNVRLLLPFVLAWALLLRPRGAPAARRALLVAAGIAAAILPFTIRNYLVSGTWVLTTSHGGINFYMGNNALATGRYVTLPFMRANPVGEAEDSRREAERRTGRTLSPAEVSAFWLAEGLRWIRENPAAAAALWLHKARLVVHEHEIPDNHSLYVTRDLFVPALHVPRLGFGLLWGPALIGALVLPWRDPRAGLPALFLVLYGASLVPFFVLDRYRLPMVPALSILAVAGALQVRRFLARGDVRRVAAVVAAAAAALFVGLGPTPESGAPVAVELYLVGNAYLKTGSPEKALPHLRQALRVYPDREDFRLSHMEALRQTNSLTVEQVREEVRREGATAARLLDLGKTLEGLGDVAGAVEAYGRAVRQDRDHAPAHARLGYLFATAPEVRDPARAAAHLEETLRLRPDDPDTLNALGNVEFLRGDREAAGTYWRRVLAVSPGHPGATQNLAALGDGKGTP
jgi:tetratricopeptide (TPR) repeat protein